MQKLHPGHETRRQKSNELKRERLRAWRVKQYKEKRHQFWGDERYPTLGKFVYCRLCEEHEDFESHELHQERLI